METRHFYNKTTFETRGFDDDVDASKYITLSEWTEYTVGQEPQALLNAIEAAKTPEQILSEKWASVNTARSILTITTDAGNKFAANQEAITAIYKKEASLLSGAECMWYEDWGSFLVTKVELQEALNKANVADQNLLDTLLV